MATLLETQISVPQAGDVAACLGAARMARAAVAPQDTLEILSHKPTVHSQIDPNPAIATVLKERFLRHRALAFRS